MMNIMQSKRNTSQRGVILVMTAFLLPLLIVLMGLAIDFGFLYVQRNKLQDVADAAALAGAARMSSEGRYDGAKLTDDKQNLRVGKTIIDYVKANDSSFQVDSLNIDNVVYKGIYQIEDSTGFSYPTKSLSNEGSYNLVKLMDLDSWIDSENYPKIASDLKVKLEYGISGRLNADNFNALYDNNVPYREDDRVRVRLTKRVILPFLGAFMDSYANGVPLTVKAAAQGSTGGAATASFSGPIVDGQMVMENKDYFNITEGAQLRATSQANNIYLSHLPAGLYLQGNDNVNDRNNLQEYGNSNGGLYVFAKYGQEKWDTAVLASDIETADAAINRSGYADNASNRSLADAVLAAKATMNGDTTATYSAINRVIDYVAANARVKLTAESPVVLASTDISGNVDVYVNLSDVNGRRFNDQIYLNNSGSNNSVKCYSLEDYNLGSLKNVACLYLRTPNATDVVIINTSNINYTNIITNGKLVLAGTGNTFNGVIYSASEAYLGGNNNNYFTSQVGTPFAMYESAIEGCSNAKAGIYCNDGAVKLGQEYSVTYSKTNYTTVNGLVLTYDSSSHVYINQGKTNQQEISERWYITYNNGGITERWYYHYDNASNNCYFINPAGYHINYLYHERQWYESDILVKTGHYFWLNDGIIFSHTKWYFDGQSWSTDRPVWQGATNQKLTSTVVSFTENKNINSYNANLGYYQNPAIAITAGVSGIKLVE